MYTIFDDNLTIDTPADLGTALIALKKLPRMNYRIHMGAVQGNVRLAEAGPGTSNDTVWRWHHGEVFEGNGYTKFYREVDSFFDYVHLPGVLVMSGRRELCINRAAALKDFNTLVTVIYGGGVSTCLSSTPPFIREHLQTPISAENFAYICGTKKKSADMTFLAKCFGETQAKIISKQIS